MPYHPSCGRRWSGLAVCHCPSCHETFSGVTLFDRHRNHHGEHGACLDPRELTGMELRDDGVWHSPPMSVETRRRWDK